MSVQSRPLVSKHRATILSIAAMVAFSACATLIAAPAEVPYPVSPDGAVKISLFAAEPDIVTPIGTTVDTHGRLLVIESQSHFRPKDYKGPPTDRIRMLEDATGSGKADHITTFYEGTNFLMNLVADRNGSVVLSSRNEIFRLFDKDGHGHAGDKVTLAHLETKSNYPHNGLHGLAIDRDGNVYFGIGENLGGQYTLIGTDGQKYSDDKGSGSIFRIDSQGKGLTRIAHGFWNPFGLGFDPAGTLWAVDNDPDGRPPCRLIQVVPGGDYGFEFRYGRTGLHPLQAWDAELPGTLGMVSGVGEAPCAVHWNQGRLLVSSWRDHQVESYSLTPHGASYTATMQQLLTGPESFRPVGLAVASDGSLYVTDWGSGSYPINGKGRVWKVTPMHPASAIPDPKPTDAMLHAAHLRESQSVDDLVSALDDSDPYIAQAAQFGLARLPQCEKIDWNTLKSPRQKIGLLAALLWRGTDLKSLASVALKDSDDRVRQMAVRAISEEGIKESKDELDQMLSSQVMSPRLLGMTVATLNQLSGESFAKIDSKKIDAVLLARINAPQATSQTKSAAFHMLQASHPHISMDEMTKFVQSSDPSLQLEAVRYLNSDSDAGRFALLAQIAGDGKYDVGVRAESLVGLADDAAGRADLLLQLAGSEEARIRQEALRSLRSIAPKLTKPQQGQLVAVAQKHPGDADLVRRLLGQSPSDRPPETEIAGWQKIVDQAPGDPDAGRRIFFHPSGPACFRCHMIEGRGRAIGPDLTMIGHSQTRDHVLESILDPSKEIAPLFTLWTITLKSGQRVDGMLLRRDGQSMEIYVDATGTEMRVPEKEVADRKSRKESLMPTGLVQALTDQELRDVLAFLTQKR
jgi:putative membrane-bound dehydrogenase-like protein